MHPRSASLSLSLSLIVSVACDEPVLEPDGQPDEASRAVAESTDPSSETSGPAHFYLYEHEKIGLSLERDRVVVAASEGDPLGKAREAVSDRPIDLNASTRLDPARPYWRLEVSAPDSVPIDSVAAALRRTGDFRFVTNVYTHRESGSPFVPVNELLVTFRDASPSQVDSLAEAYGLSVKQEPLGGRGDQYHVFAYPADADPLSVAAAVDAEPLVDWAEPNRPYDVQLASPTVPSGGPSDPYYSDQYYLKNTADSLNGVPVDINVEPAWDVSVDPNVIKVAIMDTGIDEDHDQFNLLGGFDGYQQECGVDDDCERDPPNNGEDVHGTAVAGIVGAYHDGVGTVGVMPDVVLVPVRIERIETDPFIAIYPDSIVQAITYAWSDAEADVLNFSWHGSESTSIGRAIDSAAAHGRDGDGAVVVASVGNDGDDVAWPGSMSSTIAVSAITHDGSSPSYAPSGTEIDLVAPSSEETDANCALQKGDVVTTDLWGTDGCNNGPGGDDDYTSYFGGTSAAAPQVSGAAGLLLYHEPSLTRGEVETRLKKFADDWGNGSLYGAGKLNVYRSLVPPSPPSVSISGPTTVRPDVTCSWEAQASGEEPFGYTWARDNVVLAGENSDTYTADTGTSSFSLTVWVTDEFQQSTEETISVSVSSSAPECFL